MKGLLQLAIDDKKDADQLAILRRYTQLEQHDQEAWTLYLGLLVEQKQWAEAVKAGDAAVFVDVHSPLVHMLYGKALVETNDAPRAVFELESALLCKPAKNDGATDPRAPRARARHARQDRRGQVARRRGEEDRSCERRAQAPPPTLKVLR